MEKSTEFDATLGGSEHLPFSANSLKFATSRSIEIAAMTESILQPSKTKLIFQTLPVHMRRRVMSHNSKRLPLRLRLAHLEQLKKSGLPPKQKRPSRKYRRRPTNLLQEYNRRQRCKIWLETHIWHAKRFHMIERWSHRLPYAPCDKSFKACYRASSAHCLMQDISYLIPIRISGSLESIKTMFSPITNSKCGLSICAQAYVNGSREGSICIYKQNSFPFDFIGEVQFLWTTADFSSIKKNLWLFVHPSQIKQIESLFNNLISSSENSEQDEIEAKRRKLNNDDRNIQIKILPGLYNRFRLIGPNSHAILVQSLKCVDIEKIKTDKWISLHNINYLNLENKKEYWNNIKAVKSPSELPSNSVIGLIVKDPRLSRPSYRTKAINDSSVVVNAKHLLTIPPDVSASPLWDLAVCNTIKENSVSNGQFIKHITDSQLVPGEIYEDDKKLQSLPVVLIQRPGSQDSKFKRLGYGSGWDVIIPATYGLPFWLTFIMFGARAGGLREAQNVTFEMGKTYLPPDSEAGKLEEKRNETDLKNKYFKLPPSKRVNYLKLGIISPFICPWKILLNDWSDKTFNDFFVLREKKVLQILQDWTRSLYNRFHNLWLTTTLFTKECIIKKMSLPGIDNCDECLVPIYVKLPTKGTLRSQTLICLPQHSDISKHTLLTEPQHIDVNEKLRKEKRKEHKLEQKKQRKQKRKVKTNAVTGERPLKKELSDYVMTMRELWLPSNINSVRFTGSREVIGYISHGSFSFTEACHCGIGYIAYNALKALMKLNINRVLVRNTTSRTYRLATMHVLCE